MKKFIWISFIIIGIVFGYSFSCTAQEEMINPSLSTVQSLTLNHLIVAQKTTEECDEDDEDCPDNKKSTPKPGKKETSKHA